MSRIPAFRSRRKSTCECFIATALKVKINFASFFTAPSQSQKLAATLLLHKETFFLTREKRKI
jgi:hypothetical protein